MIPKCGSENCCGCRGALPSLAWTRQKTTIMYSVYLICRSPCMLQMVICMPRCSCLLVCLRWVSLAACAPCASFGLPFPLCVDHRERKVVAGTLDSDTG